MDLMISVLTSSCTPAVHSTIINAMILIGEWMNVQLPYPATP